MTKRRILLLAIALLLLAGMPVLAEDAISPETKQQLFNKEADILNLLKERHSLAGEAIDLRVRLLEVKKRAVPANAADVQKELYELNTLLKEKNAQIEAKNQLIQEKTKELRALLPGKKAEITPTASTTTTKKAIPKKKRKKTR